MDSVAVSEAVDPGSTPGACTIFRPVGPRMERPVLEGQYCTRCGEVYYTVLGSWLPVEKMVPDLIHAITFLELSYEK